MKRRGGGARKIGNRIDKCKRYLTERRRIRNKKCKLESAIRKFSEDMKQKIRKACPIGRRKEMQNI